MSDIIERLREGYPSREFQREAADEIEKLRGEVAALNIGRRFNFEKTDDGIRVCYGSHEKHEDCEWIEYVPKAERDAAVADAERYRWLRPRLEVRHLEAVSGGRRPAMQIRIGHSYFDSTHRPGAGYLNPAHFQQECEELDAAIDAAKGEK